MTEDVSVPRLCVLGTGEFARSLASRLRRYGVQFWFGSRNPSRTPRGPLKEVLDESVVKSIDECCSKCNVFIVAIHPRHYDLLAKHQQQLTGKTVIDVSNERPAPGESSSARLVALLPDSAVVKAFNTVSARVMALDEGRCVHVCADDPDAKRTALELASRIGFTPVDCGMLANGGALEAKANKLFPGWGWPSLVVLVVLAFWVVFTTCRAFKLRRNPYSPERLPSNVVNKIVGAVAATCLSLTFMPGCIVAFAQLVRGTKLVDLPKFISAWLDMRLHLGLFALFWTALHAILSLALLSPPYFPKWYPRTDYLIHVNGTDVRLPIGIRMTWIGETVILMGTLALAAMSLIGISTIPSVSKSLSWREWRYVQSHLGFVCVLLTVLHLTVKGAPVWINKDVKDIIPTVTFLSSVLPWLTVGMRIVLYLPCVYRRVARIKNGQLSRVDFDKRQDGVKTRKKERDGELSIVV